MSSSRGRSASVVARWSPLSRRIGLLAVGGLVLTVAASCGGSQSPEVVKTGTTPKAINTPAQSSPRDTTPEQWQAVLQEVSLASTRYTGPEHGTAQYTISSRNAAMEGLGGGRVSGDGKTTDEDEVYVFVLEGSFQGKYVRVMPGAEQPAGKALVFTISRGPSVLAKDDTPVILDIGLLDDPPDLSRLATEFQDVSY